MANVIGTATWPENAPYVEVMYWHGDGDKSFRWRSIVLTSSRRLLFTIFTKGGRNGACQALKGVNSD